VLHFEQESTDGDSEAFQAHFYRAAARDPNDIGREANRIMGMLRGETIEEDSPPSELIYAVAKHADTMAYDAISEALGVDSDALWNVITRWQSLKIAGRKPPPIEPAALASDVTAMKKYIDELDPMYTNVPPLTLSFHKE
jgi:hypothetical protein